MRHICLITTSYPDTVPGTEAAGSFVEDFARALSAHVRVTVVAAASVTRDTTEGNVEIRRFAIPMMPLSLLSPSRPTHWLPILTTLRAGSAALDRVLASDRPDHILALWALPSGRWARQAWCRYGIGYSVWALGSDIWSLGKLPVVRSVLARVLDSAEHRFADGLQLCGDVESLCGRACDFMPSTRLLASASSIEPANADGVRLAFLGRWHVNKGVDLLLESLDRLVDEDWRRIAEVRLFGGGPLDDTVRSRADRLARSGRPVRVGGYLDRDQAAALIGWADYLLLPSRIESIPVIFSDAMQLSTPIISTPVGDLPRLFENYDVGVIADAADAQAFAAAIQAGIRRQPRDFADGIVRARAAFDLSKIVQQFLTTLRGGAS